MHPFVNTFILTRLAMKVKKVLIIDDNATNLTILKNQLEQWKLTPCWLPQRSKR